MEAKKFHQLLITKLVHNVVGRKLNKTKSVASDFQDADVQDADLPKHILLNQKKGREAAFYRDKNGKESRNASADFSQKTVLKCYLDIQPNSFAAQSTYTEIHPPTSLTMFMNGN